MRTRRLLALAAAAALPLAGGLGAVSSAPASAAVLPQVHVISNGAAGYSAAFGNAFDNMGANVITAPAGLDIGGVGIGGIGIQGCDPNTGFGLQVGETSDGSAFTVEYATGILQGAAADHCVGNPLLAGPHVLNANLTGIPVGDDVQVFWSFHNVRVWECKSVKHHRRCHRRWQGRAKFQAIDLTSGFEVYSANINTAPDWNLTEAGVGVEQDTTGLSACTPTAGIGVAVPTAPVSPTSGLTPTGYSLPPAGYGPASSGACTLVASFAEVFTDGHGLGLPGFGLAFAPETTQVVTTAGGLAVNAATVAPDYTLNPTAGPAPSALSVYAGETTT